MFILGSAGFETEVTPLGKPVKANVVSASYPPETLYEILKDFFSP